MYITTLHLACYKSTHVCRKSIYGKTANIHDYFQKPTEYMGSKQTKSERIIFEIEKLVAHSIKMTFLMNLRKIITCILQYAKGTTEMKLHIFINSNGRL
jgi:hypothetical protein